MMRVLAIGGLTAGLLALAACGDPAKVARIEVPRAYHGLVHVTIVEQPADGAGPSRIATVSDSGTGTLAWDTSTAMTVQVEGVPPEKVSAIKTEFLRAAHHRQQHRVHGRALITRLSAVLHPAAPLPPIS